MRDIRRDEDSVSKWSVRVNVYPTISLAMRLGSSHEHDLALDNSNSEGTVV